MPTALATNPLPTALSMTQGHDKIELFEFGRHGPLAYLYAERWDPTACDCGPEDHHGSYDPDAQIWLGDDGEIITAGVCTGTRTSCNGADRKPDDACF
ncbi:MAG: hypothetical protein ACRD2C_03975 [Acidimicrobiales bacterium]